MKRDCFHSAFPQMMSLLNGPVGDGLDPTSEISGVVLKMSALLVQYTVLT